MPENTYKQIKRTIETIEEKIPIELPPVSRANKQPSWVTLIGLLIPLVSAIISLADYWDKQKRINQDKLIGESKEQSFVLPPSEVERQKEKASIQKKIQLKKEQKYKRKKLLEKRRRKRQYRRRYNQYNDW